MPRVFVYRGYVFFFFSNEGDPLEPIHIHVRNGEKLAKFWVKPEIKLANSYGFSSKELNAMLKIVTKKTDLIEEAWNEHFGI